MLENSDNFTGKNGKTFFSILLGLGLMQFYAYRTGTTYDAFDTGDALEPCGVADQILLSAQKELIVKFHEKELHYMIAFRAPKEVQL